MLFHRARAQVQLAGDLLRQQPARDQARHFLLALTQRLQPHAR
jgi:hypothetical protein